MFNPYNFLVLLIGVYLLLPTLGFGLFPEYFHFSASTENFMILGAYISVLLITGLAAKRVECSGKNSSNCISANQLQRTWMSRGAERRALLFLIITTFTVALVWVLIIFSSGMLNGEFSPHEFRMGVSSSENLALIIAYNVFSLLTLVTTNLTLLSIEKARCKTPFRLNLALQIVLVIITGQRSILMLVFFSYLFLKSTTQQRASKTKIASVLLLGFTVVTVLGVLRQGSDFSYTSFMWQLSVRFDLFYPQFFNFLDVYHNLPDIGYGYFHFTLPLQIIPSSLMNGKPSTFLQFINRDLMNISAGTGNDFTAFAEFIYNYGITIGWLFYAAHCFTMSFIIQRIYRRARYRPVYFALYFPSLLVYISVVLLTGISNQAHIFSIAGILTSILPCVFFINFTKEK